MQMGVHTCMHRPLTVQIRATMGREGGRWGLGKPSLSCQVPVQNPEKSKNSLFELDLLGFPESLGVKVGGYNLFY